MPIHVGALEFEGPHTDLDLLSDTPGIYAVLCQNGAEYEVIEMGESEYVRQHLHAHPRRASWNDQALEISIAVHYTGDLTAHERHEIKDALEREFGEPVVA